MTAVRHLIANGLYSVAQKVDRPVRCSEYKGFDIGAPQKWEHEAVTATLHTDKETPIGASFHPPEGRSGYTYCALRVGGMTMFMSRQSTERLGPVVRSMERLFDEYGSGSYDR